MLTRISLKIALSVTSLGLSIGVERIHLWNPANSFESFAFGVKFRRRWRNEVWLNNFTSPLTVLSETEIKQCI